MEKFKEWWERFSTWVQYEPVKASEQVRMLLLSLTGIVGVTGNDPVLTGVMGAITTLFSIWASKSSRNKVMPMKRVEAEYTPRGFTDTDLDTNDEYNV